MASNPAPEARTGELLSPGAASSALVANLTYRSRAVTPMSELDLHRLAKAAQLRNADEGVTGLMVYDRGWIFQQLEGPADGLARIWASIRRDPRHASIDVVSAGSSEKRDFASWDMKLSVTGAEAGLGARGMVDEPPEMIDRLCRGERPLELMFTASPDSFEKRAQTVVSSEALLLYGAALSEVIATVVVPRLFAARPASDQRPASFSSALASLLIAVDATSAFKFVEAALYRYVSLGSLATRLLEPAARDLGDLWQSDDCSEIEVTLGLSRLQAIAREFGLGTPRQKTPDAPVVLVVPQPGEAHMLGAALDAEMLWQAGWRPRVDFPSTDRALDRLVASTWIDALDLSLSTSFRRDHRLDQVEKTITGARTASLNPEMVVVVSGRLFSNVADAIDSAATGRRIGADGVFGSASQAHSAISRALHRPLDDGHASDD